MLNSIMKIMKNARCEGGNLKFPFTFYSARFQCAIDARTGNTRYFFHPLCRSVIQSRIY